VRESDKCTGVAWRKTRKIRVPRLDTYRAYLVALHEISHIIFPRPALKFDREVIAWKGARKLARLWTDEANTVMRACLGSYIRYYKCDGRIKLSRSARKFLQGLA
jgi:hypothetical protein